MTILQLEGEELSRAAGEVLEQANCQECVDNDGSHSGCTWWVSGICNDGEGCVHLTWPEAMKWRDWIEDTDLIGANKYYEAVWRACRGGCFEPWGRWFTLYAQPSHYIKAACICAKENV